MSIIIDILEGLWDMELNYKGVRVNYFGVPRFLLGNNKETSVRSALSRMKNKGYIIKNQKGLAITEKGKNLLKNRKNVLKDFNSSLIKNSQRNLLVIFDIPESRKIERAWFRKHLIKFNYLMIQKSVWVGPSPLPKEFVSYIKDIRLDSCIKTFKLSNPYRFKNNKD